MNDLIKKEDAIDAIECVTWYHQNRNKDMVEGANSDEHQAWYKSQDVYKALESIPSADRQQGYWIKDDGAFKCSVCGEREDAFTYGWDWETFGESKFCPSCGAKMKGTDNETLSKM